MVVFLVVDDDDDDDDAVGIKNVVESCCFKMIIRTMLFQPFVAWFVCGRVLL